jgi:hypothetical protein
VDDGRVCGVLAVSRAFGDCEFKGTGLPRLLKVRPLGSKSQPCITATRSQHPCAGASGRASPTPGLPALQSGIERGYWDAEFAAKQRFSSDPVVCTPDVTETQLGEVGPPGASCRPSVGSPTLLLAGTGA